MKKISAIFLLIAACAFQGQASDFLNISKDWKFQLCKDGVVVNCSGPSLDDAAWRSLDLPHDWSIEGKYDKANPSGTSGGYMPCGTAWYRKHLTLGKEYEGKRVTIRFEGVYMDSETWVNGHMVGRYPNGYNSFEYDITPFVNLDGSDNVIAVKVDNSLQPGSRWYTGSGIYREVKLLVDNQLHFVHDAVFVRTVSADRQKATVSMDCRVIAHAYPESSYDWFDNASFYVWTKADENSAEKTQPDNRIKKQCEIRFSLLEDGKVISSASETRFIGDYTENDFSLSLDVDSPRLWSSQDPQLYDCICEVLCEGQVMDSQKMKVGIRQIKFDSEHGMTVNGVPEKIQGICIHQSAGCFGSAVPREVMEFRLRQLKDMGCNAVRLAHYPHAPFVYDICDEIGLYATNEIFDEWNRGQDWGYSESPFGKMDYSYYRFFNQWHDTDLRNMIRRDRNHACVILYLLGNEVPNQRIQGKEIARELIDIAHAEDPTRPVTAGCDFFVGADIYGFMGLFDIAGYNYIDRIHKDSLYMAEHVRHPERILLGTETYHSYKNHATIEKTGAAIGEFVWVGYDYLGEITCPDNRGWNDGIFDVAGFPKSETYLRKCLWSKDPVVYAGVLEDDGRDFDWRIRPVKGHWNWSKGETVTVYAYSNCEEVELFAGGRKSGRMKVDADSCCVCWKVPYKAGKLTAVGYNGGKKVAQWSVESTEDTAAGFVAKRLNEDSEGNIAIFEVDALDSKGRRIPTYSGTFKVQASGGEIVGIDNGSQYDPEGRKYTSREVGSFYEGRAIVYVKTSEGCSDATISVTQNL